MCYEQYNIVAHNIPTVSTLLYSVHMYYIAYTWVYVNDYPKWVLQGKKFAAQKIMVSYLWIQGGDFLTISRL